MTEFVDFEYFKQLAGTAADANARSGFGPEHRAGKTAAILEDILPKLPSLRPGGKLIDIGSGCSDLTTALLEACAAREVTAVLVDSEEVLSRVEGVRPGVIKAPHRFPDSGSFLAEHMGSATPCFSTASFTIWAPTKTRSP